MNHIQSLTNTDREACSEVLSEFDRAREIHSLDIAANNRAHRRYFPTEYGKFEPEELKEFEEDGRVPHQIDIASHRVDTLVGSIVSDLPDPTWIPVHGERSLLTEAISLKYHTDKDMYNYGSVFLKVLKNGIIHSGDLVISEDWKYDEPGIRLDSVLYGYNILWDPYWMTDDDRDAEVYWRIGHLNPVKLIAKYSNVRPEIEKEVQEYKKGKRGYASDPRNDKADHTLGKVGDEFQVIEKHYLKEIHTKRLVGRRTDDNYWIPFPLKKDQEYLSHFAEQNGIDWETVEEVAYHDRVEYVSTAIRQLGVCVQSDVKGKVQVNGLSAHHFSARMHRGRNMGIMASIADVEDIINKRENLVSDHLTLAANGGLINESVFPDEAKWKEFNKNKNKVGRYTKAPLDDVKKVMERIMDNPGNNDIERQIQRALKDYLPLVSRVSETLTSMGESGESGIMFERKFQTNMIANTVLNRNIRQLLNNVAESYFYQYQITYGEQKNILVNDRGGSKVAVVLNQEKDGKDGVSVRYNWVQDTPRCRVVMSENKNSPTYQMRWRSIWGEMLTAINPEVGNGIALPYYILALRNFFGTIEIKEEDKDTQKVIDDMVMMIARLKLVAEASQAQTGIANNTLMNAQIDMQLQQIMQQMQQSQPEMGAVNHDPVMSRQVQYPDINPQQTEAAQREAIPPAGPELSASDNPAESTERILK